MKWNSTVLIACSRVKALCTAGGARLPQASAWRQPHCVLYSGSPQHSHCYLVSTSNSSLMGRATPSSNTSIQKDESNGATPDALNPASHHHVLVDQLFRDRGIDATVTKGGWCLKEALIHVMNVDSETAIYRVIQERGLPGIYGIVEDAECRHGAPETTMKDTKPQDCFQSLCRIIAGQQLAGAAARAMWNRLLTVTNRDLTPRTILHLANEKDMEADLRKPAGLSRAKCNAIVALATAFHNKELTEDFLRGNESTEEEIRKALLPIKGIGPWTCDMFLMFYLEKANVLPLGDLGVRKGIAKYFGLVGKGKGYKGSLCQAKDKDVMEGLVEPYKPFQSVFTYYMWKVADTDDFYRDPVKAKPIEEAATSTAKGSKGKRKRKSQ